MNTEEYVILAFPTVYWSHNWERQHELIYQYAKKTCADVYVFPPFGFINYNIKDIFFKVINKYKEKVRVSDTKNPKMENMHFLYDIFFIPYHNVKIIRVINKKLITYQIRKKYANLWDNLINTQQSILFATYSTDIILDLIDIIKPSILVVDIAQRRKFSKLVPSYAIKFEEELIRRADVVFSDSLATCEDYNMIKQISYFCQGVSIEKFQVNHSIIEEMENINKPIIGYVGALHDSIDYDILDYAISENSDFQFVFIGNIVDKYANKLLKYDNVRFLGRKSYEELPNYMQYFKVGLVPYKMNDFSNGISPTKLFEYGIMKIPIVSTNIREVNKYSDVIKIASNKYEFSKMIRDTINLSQNEIDILKEKLYKLSIDNSWDKKFDYFYSKIMEVLKKRRDVVDEEKK